MLSAVLLAAKGEGVGRVDERYDRRPPLDRVEEVRTERATFALG